MGHISDAISPTYFILGTKVQPHRGAFIDLSADDLDPRSRSNVKVKFSAKWVKNQRTGHISEAISPTDFIPGTKVQANKAYSMIQVPMTLTLGQGQKSRSNFPQNGKKTKQLAISRRLFHIQTSYLVPRYNLIRRITTQ